MAVSDLAAAVDRVLATLPTPALREADGCRDEAANVLAVVFIGSAAPELVEAADGLLRAREGLAQVQQTCSALSEVLGQYLTGIGVGSAGAASSTLVRPPSLAPRPEPASVPDPVLIAEVQRQGHKISPARVVRIARLPDERIVWLEEGIKAEDCGISWKTTVYRNSLPMGSTGSISLTSCLPHSNRVS